VRVLLFHPWGRFDPAHCGASRTALAHLEYCRVRGWDVHVLVQEAPALGAFARGAETFAAQCACVKSVRVLRLDCAPVAPRDYGDEFRQLLYARARAARGTAFRLIRAEPWDAFLTTDVTAAPFAHALPRVTRKVLAVGDSYSRRAARGTDRAPALRAAEERFAFARIEAELYRLFTRVLLTTETDAQRARRYGADAALHVPPLIEPRTAPDAGEHDLVIRAGDRSGDCADVEWFYRHVFLPHLRAAGVRLALAGPGAVRFPVCDLRVAKLPSAEGAPARIAVAPACEAAGPHVAVADALAAGRAVVTTPEGARGFDVPDDAAVVIDMHRDPAATAAVIRDLLAAPGWRRALGERAARVTEQHTRARFFAALDRAWDHVPSSRTV
jgi:hypothetical protein